MAYVIVSAVILIYTVALSVLSFEKSAANANITTMGDALWWAIVTVTTIGYGDFYPVTVWAGGLRPRLMVGGFAVLSMVTAAVSSWLVESVTAATNQRRQADEIIGSDELARLTAQLNRLHDQLARDRGASDGSPADPPKQRHKHAKNLTREPSKGISAVAAGSP